NESAGRSGRGFGGIISGERSAILYALDLDRTAAEWRRVVTRRDRPGLSRARAWPFDQRRSEPRNLIGQRHISKPMDAGRQPVQVGLVDVQLVGHGDQKRLAHVLA